MTNNKKKTKYKVLKNCLLTTKFPAEMVVAACGGGVRRKEHSKKNYRKIEVFAVIESEECMVVVLKYK